MEKLAEQQSANGLELQKIVTNYKKDPINRKTKEYYEQRLQRLNDAWAIFEAADNEIREIQNLPLNHPYFEKDYYNTIKRVYDEYVEHFTLQIERLDQPPASSLKKNPFDTVAATNSKTAANTSPQGEDIANIVDEGSDLVKRCLRRQQRNVTILKRMLSTVIQKGEARPRQYYELKLSDIKELWNNVQEDDRLIWELLEDPISHGYDAGIYAELEEEVEEIILNLRVRAEEMVTTSPATNTALKLPKLTLPRFDGDYLRWQQFHDLFSQMVHNQPMANCQKMFYLKSNLAGEAERLIRHFTTSEENYNAAWKTLVDRYNNPRLLVAALLNKLMSQPTHAHDQPSATAIKALHDTTQECLLGLQNLGISTKDWDPLLLHILIRKLDKTTHTLYEQSLANPRGIQKLSEFLDFLEVRFQALESLGNRGRFDDDKRKRSIVQTLTSSARIQRSAKSCTACKGEHRLYACEKFLNLSPSNRLNFLQRNNLCTNCLQSGHKASNCSSRSCTKCGKRHNTLVHIETSNTGTQQTSNDSTVRNPTTIAALTNNSTRSYIFLSTAIVKLITAEGTSIDCRALLDSGSQVNLVTERLVRKLNLTPKGDSLTIQGVGGNKAQMQKRVTFSLKSKLNEYGARVEAFVMPKIVPPQPTQTINVTSWPIPQNIKLADPNFNISSNVDLLLGAEFYHELLCVGQIKLADDLPLLQNTTLGWIVIGKAENATLEEATCGICTEEETVNEIIERFWKLEEAETSSSTLTPQEQKCESHFNRTVQRDECGRFVVSLPFSNPADKLGESRDIALRRFQSLERRLQRDPALKEQYVKFMQEYIDLSHMKEIAIDTLKPPYYFLPHHCVLKPDSSTTKLRVVFDASAKTSSGLSLNDLLCAGPKTQDDLFSILLRFRMPRFVFTADIKQMYRQILVQKDDRRFQLIFWRSEPHLPLKCYQLQTVTYGTTSAPYLATKCLQRLAQEGEGKYPLGSKVLNNDFYMDDVITGADKLATALEAQAQLQDMLREAGLQLRKWCANHPKLLESIPVQDQELCLDFRSEADEKIKTLGLTWHPKSDEFHIKVTSKESSAITKRTVASDIARLFDPLGIMGPVIVTAKIFLQQIWELKLDWDAALPIKLHTEWTKFRNELNELDKIHFNRHIFAHESPQSLQLHTFCDASQKAYGAAVYIRSINKEKRTIVRLLCAKSRIAPIKKPSTPRLELCAAVLAAQLTERVKRDLKLLNAPTYFWSDSEIVLAWINSNNSKLQTFVANRIAIIQERSKAQQWRHVSSEENPADVLSRGITPSQLAQRVTWFYGPQFLHRQEDMWTTPYNKELRITALNLSIQEDFLGRINHNNSFRRLQRIIAYVLRFINYTRNLLAERHVSRSCTPHELDEAMLIIVRTMQQAEFKEEFKQLQVHAEVHKDSPLSSLTPMLDENLVIRVGGRLEASTLSHDAKHPMVLPYSHPLTRLLMIAIHQENMHVGPQNLLAITRQRFWPIKGKNIARAVVQHCVYCTRKRPKLYEQMMGNLPPLRVQPARPFINTGVDFCGPIWVHFKIRGKKPQKAYIAVFCCFSTKAVHLELVSDLTTDAFLGALKRFVGRRGNCKTIFCDNATNFTGAKNQLRELTDIIHDHRAIEKIVSTCSKKGIEFKFIPPRAPHFGGLWEAAVKSAKHLLLKSISSASLTYEELETVVIEAEAILNSRPLTAMSTDPNDLTALTPGHFLIGEPLTSQIDTKAEPLKSSLLSRWKLVSHIKHEFWRRWSNEYLNELQHRYKWKTRCQNAKPGTIVIIKEDNTPVLRWPLGRIVRIFPGEDGLVRVAEVKTASGIFKRPIHRLAPLPIEDTQGEVENDSQDNTNTACENEPMEEDIRCNTKAETTRNPEGPPARKLARTSLGAAIVTFLMACIVLPTANCTPIEIIPFQTQPGIYFENLGTTNIISSEWNIVAYYDMESYWKEFAALGRHISTLKKVCRLMNETNACPIMVDHFQQLSKELSDNNEFLAPPQEVVRTKRGAINIVGNLANALFGVLDSDYAEEMSKTIENIKQNEDHIYHLIKKQTSIIDATMNIIKRDFETINQQFQDLQAHVNQVTRQIDEIHQELYEEKLSQMFTLLSVQTMLVISNVQRTQSSILDVLINTHHGKISPRLISPTQLKQELHNIKGQLPPTLRLPITTDEGLKLYNLMSIEGRPLKAHIIFRLKLPLITIEDFELFRVIPVPVLINNTFMTIEPSYPFLVINLHRDQYYPLSRSELDLCLSTAEYKHLCKQRHPIYHKGSKISECEVHLLNHMPQPSSCQVRLAGDGPHWIQLHNSNQWIFSLGENITVNIVCDGQVTQAVIKGAGILKMQGECIIKQQLMTIQGHKVPPTSLKISYTPVSNLTDFVIPRQAEPLEITNNTNYHLQQNWDSIQKQLQQLSMQSVRIQPHDVHQFTIGYSSLIISLAVTIIVIIWYLRRRFQRPSKPKPRPRRHINDEQMFSIDPALRTGSG